MTRLTRTLSFFVLCSMLAPGLSGCIEVKLGPTLYPDGSGKLVMTVGFKKSMMEMMGGGGQNPFDEFENPDPAKMKQDFPGIVAWVIGAAEEDDEWKRITLTGYFEDIDDVQFNMNKGNEGKAMTFDYVASGEGGSVVLSGNLGNDAGSPLDGPGGSDNEGGKAMLEAMKPMLEGLSLEISITVPGTITEQTGFGKSEGSTASFGFDGALILESAEASKEEREKLKEKYAYLEAQERKITWAKNEVTQAQIDAFKAEMADAIAKWEGMEPSDEKKPEDKK